MTLPAKPRGKAAQRYAEEHAKAQGELDALKYATDLRTQRLGDILADLERLLEKARGVIAERPETSRKEQT